MKNTAFRATTARLLRSAIPLSAMLGAVAACDSGDDPCKGAETSKQTIGRLTMSSVGKVDLLLAIDNSRSMSDKQQILAIAVPDLVRSFANPPCVDPSTGEVLSVPEGPQSPCPAGSKRRMTPIVDIHVGVISSSLGGHGSDACGSSVAGKASNNDKAHLLSRKDPTLPDVVPTYQDLGFLAWDPTQAKSPPGEADLESDTPADPGSTALVPVLRDLILGVGQVGCGYESQLESWYRFLIDPTPPESVVVDDNKVVVAQGIDNVLLQQRKAFLRPDSMVAIVMLTDENDCSIRESGQFYLAAQQKTPEGAPFHLPKARDVCYQDPDNDCCFSCGQKGPLDANGQPLCPDDPTCTGPDGKTVYLDDFSDNINLRCFEQKRRFGIDFLYDTDRYVRALRDATVIARDGSVVPNPLFSDLDMEDGTPLSRTSSLVLLAGLVGVPWQDIARANENGVPDLLAGLDSAGRPRGGFKDANELNQILPGQDATTWDVILGPNGGLSGFPQDPLMRESVQIRSGQNPITGDTVSPPDQPLSNPINGNDRTIPKKDDLQYACIFPLVKANPDGTLSPTVRDCSTPGTPACECEDKGNDSPLCEVNPATGQRTNQVRAGAYPGLRELAVLRDLGYQAIVGSVCAAQLTDPTGADFGYRQALLAIGDRLSPSVDGTCFQPVLHPDAEGRVTCAVIEATHVSDAEAASCNACDLTSRLPIQGDRVQTVQSLTTDPELASFNFNCFCEIPQLTGAATGAPLWACQNDASATPVDSSGALVNGYCYVDADQGVGNPEIVERCSSDDRRLLRFVGEGQARPGYTLFLACTDSVTQPPDPACTENAE